MANSAIQSILTASFSTPQFLATNENLSGNGNVLWKGMAVVEVDVTRSAAVTDYPLIDNDPKDSETTEKIENTELQALKILTPSKVRVSALIGDLSTLEKIIDTFKNSTVTISITTKSLIVNSLIMTDLKISQSADMLTASKVDMSFEQADKTDNAKFKPEQSGDSSMFGTGVQDPKSISGTLGSLGNTISNAVSRVPVTIFGPLLNNKGGPFILDHLKNGMLA